MSVVTDAAVEAAARLMCAKEVRRKEHILDTVLAETERTWRRYISEAVEILAAALPHLVAGRDAEIARLRDVIDNKDKVNRTVLAAVDERDARIAKLEAALKPFADSWDDDEAEDRWELWERPEAMCITIGDLRRARAALEQKP